MRMAFTKKELQFLRDSLDEVIRHQNTRLQKVKHFDDKELAELIHKVANHQIARAGQLRDRIQNEVANFGLV